MKNYLNKLQEKCNIPAQLMPIIESLFNRLIDFGYITNKQAKNLSKKLYDNVDTLILGNSIGIDYKSGYYDAVKKELYIKDISNVESIYLRILYVISTTELSEDTYAVGYSTAKLSKSNYKIVHKNFGINRAVVSNLVCRLLYTIPETLSIIPTYRTFSSDFLGNEIKSDNDIYFLEGKLLSQFCYTLNLNEEDLYNNLFSSNPNKYLNKFFVKAKLANIENLLIQFDKLSRIYSNYNKLCFLNNSLNVNFINIKKNILNNNAEQFKKEEQVIKLAIQTALIKLSPEEENDKEIDFESSLSEKTNELEEKIIKLLSSIQNILVTNLIEQELKYPVILYAIKLKNLDKALLIPNKKLKEVLYQTIIHNLLSNSENNASNLIEKIKFSIVNEIISSDKYIRIYKNMFFRKLEITGLENKSNIVALNVDNEFIQLVEINSLNKVTKKLENNTRKIQLDNLGYLLNNPSALSTSTNIIEKLTTSIRNFHKEFNNIKVENIYITDYNNFKLAVIRQENGFSILKLAIVNSPSDIKFDIKQVKLSQNFSVFNLNGSSSSLPMHYTKRKNPIQKILSLFNFI